MGREMYSAHVAPANPCQLKGHFQFLEGSFGNASVQEKAGIGRICSKQCAVICEAQSGEHDQLQVAHLVILRLIPAFASRCW